MQTSSEHSSPSLQTLLLLAAAAAVVVAVVDGSDEIWTSCSILEERINRWFRFGVSIKIFSTLGVFHCIVLWGSCDTCKNHGLFST